MTKHAMEEYLDALIRAGFSEDSAWNCAMLLVRDDVCGARDYCLFIRMKRRYDARDH